MSFLDAAWRHAAPALLVLPIENLAAPLLESLEKYGFAEITEKPDARDSLRARCLWEEAERRGIRTKQVRLFGRGKDLFIARFGDEIRIFNGLPRIRGKYAKSLLWMDDKGVIKKKFGRAGIPCARGGVRTTLASALRLFRKLRKPVVTKPNAGSASRHTTIHIETEEGFARAFKNARKLSPWIVVEEELFGSVFRATLVGGKAAAVIRRDEPHVIGDGKHTVRELFEEENRRPIRQGPIFSKILGGPEADAELKRQKISWDSIPGKSRRVSLNQKINWSGGGSTEDVSDKVHPENIALFEKIGAFLGDPIVGVDFIAQDISRSWGTQDRAGVIECNSLPFIDTHHYPFSGKPRNVAGALWDVVFPGGAERFDS